MPEITFRLVALWLHLLAVIVWIGGALFLSLALLPTLGEQPGADELGWLDRLERRVRRVMWLAIHALILTGIFNLVNHGLAINFRFSTPYMHLLGTKLLLVLVMLILHGIDHWSLAAKRRAHLVQGEERRLEGLVKGSLGIAATNLLLAMIVLFIGLSLRGG